MKDRIWTEAIAIEKDRGRKGSRVLHARVPDIPFLGPNLVRTVIAGAATGMERIDPRAYDAALETAIECVETVREWNVCCMQVNDFTLIVHRVGFRQGREIACLQVKKEKNAANEFAMTATIQALTEWTRGDLVQIAEGEDEEAAERAREALEELDEFENELREAEGTRH